MITAIDSNVLLDILTLDPEHSAASREAFDASHYLGSLIACEVVFAEVSAWFLSPSAAQDAFRGLPVGFSPIDIMGSLKAGRAWRAYRERGGKRSRMVADFLIGAHALEHADRLLTRDRGFYRAYFKDLRILDPTGA